MFGPFAFVRSLVRIVARLVAVVLIVGCALAFALYVQARSQPAWRAANSLEKQTVEEILDQMGIARLGWSTLIVAASQETPLPRAKLWAAWADLTRWPAWSAPMVESARWVGPPGWRKGARFEQQLDLGPRDFPGESFGPFNWLVRAAGRRTAQAQVVAVESGRSVGWRGGAQRPGRRWFRTYHVWTFQDMAGGGTLVTDVEVFDGPLAGLLKPIVRRHWNGYFARAVAGLIETAGGGIALAPADPLAY